MKQTNGYRISLNPAYSGVDYKIADKLTDQFKEKYNVLIYFPIPFPREMHRISTIKIPKGNLSLLEDLLDVLSEHHYCVTGIEPINI
jgi:hypothetical protein